MSTEKAKAAKDGKGKKSSKSSSSTLDQVRKDYLSDVETGLVSAIRDSLKSLFAEPRLPDNPYYYLASTLAAYVDQDRLWKQSDLAIAGAFDDDGGLEMLDTGTKLCRLAGQGKAWGLPHVLRLASKHGVNILHDVLTSTMPDSFFPGPTSFANEDGYAVQVLSTLQGVSAIWRPQWQEFPNLVVRADVVVRGPRPEGALAAYAELVVADLADLEEVPVYFVTQVALVEGLATVRAAGERRAPLSVPCMSLGDMRARPEEWRRQLTRGVLAGKVLEVAAVLMLETPVDGRNLENRKHKFEMVTKRYSFHFVPSNDAQQESSSSYNAMALSASHYGSLPYEALYEGFFLDVAAARQYIMLWLATQRAPYRQANLTANMDQLMDLVEHDFATGATLEALRRLLLLVMLQDARILTSATRPPVGPGGGGGGGGGVPGMLLTMEELLTQGGPTAEQRLALGAVPNLIRMLNTGAAMLEGVTNELEAITLVSQAWPAKHSALLAITERRLADPALQTQQQTARRASQDSAAGGLAVDEAALRVADLGDTAAWLVNYDMEGQLLDQLQALQGRIAAVTGGGVFSGISVLVDALMLRLGGVLSGRPLVSASPESAQQHLQPLFTSWTQAEADPRQAHWRKLRHAHKNAAAGAWFSSEDIVHGGGAGSTRPPPAYARRFTQDWTRRSAGGGQRAWSGPIWAQDTRAVMQELKTVLGAAGLTLADGLLDRCRNVLWVMHTFNLTACDDMMARTSAQDSDAVAVEWVLNVSDAMEAQVRSGTLAERVAVEGVMLQYAIDVKLDQMLSDCYRVLTEPPMPVNPYPQLLHYIRAYAARLELWKEDMVSMVEQRCNQLTLLQPPSFIYEASPPAAAPTSALLQSSRARPAEGDLDDETLVVYGCYAAVMLCDIRAVHTLAGSLGGLLAERCSQSGAYDITVLPALTGAASISAALQLEDDQDSRMAALGSGASGAAAPEGTKAKGDKGGGPGQAGGATSSAASSTRPPYEHPRWHGVETEEHYLIVGPSSTAAAGLFAAGVVEYAVQLHRDTFHLIQAISVGPAKYTLSQLLALEGQQACIKALTAAAIRALTAEQDLPGALQAAARPLGTLQMQVTVREGLYVPLVKQLLFQYRKTGLPYTTLNTGDDAQRYGAIGTALSVPNQPEPHWPPEVYQRVFLSAAAATTWWQWNRALGDPGQPYHVRHLLAYLQQLVHEQEAQGELLATQKLLLLAATASQDVELLYHVMHALASKAQELHCLQGLNATLVQLMTINDPEQLAKLDTERLRRLFLQYTSRMLRAARSPKYCYFSGFAAAAPQLLTDLKEQVLASYRLSTEHIERMAQLQLWTRCCEVSVADSIHDCFSRDLIDNVLERAQLQDEDFMPVKAPILQKVSPATLLAPPAK